MNISLINEVEDILHSAEVFVHGLDFTPANMEDGLTVLDYDKLVPTISLIKSNYSISEWKELISYWDSIKNPTIVAIPLVAYIKQNCLGE